LLQERRLAALVLFVAATPVFFCSYLVVVKRAGAVLQKFAQQCKTTAPSLPSQPLCCHGE